MRVLAVVTVATENENKDGDVGVFRAIRGQPEREYQRFLEENTSPDARNMHPQQEVPSWQRWGVQGDKPGADTYNVVSERLCPHGVS